MERTNLKLINVRPLILGVEFNHAVIVSLSFIFVFFFTNSILAVVLVSAALYLVFRILMARKPRLWLEDFIQYQLGEKNYLALTRRRGK